MKPRYYLPVLAVLLLALAGLGFAQDDYYDDSGYHQLPTFKWESPEIQPQADTNAVRDPGVYYNDSGIQHVPTFKWESTPAFYEHAGKTGNLKLGAAVKLGGTLLQPGDYEVRHVNTPKGHYVEFSQMVDNDIVLDGMSPYKEQVVARVNCIREPLNTVVARTELEPDTAGTLARLEIRGEKVVHLF